MYRFFFVFLLVTCGRSPSPITSGDIIQSFRSAGLVLVNVQSRMDIPISATDATRFEIPGGGIGNVVAFHSVSDALHFQEASAGTGAWYFQKGIIVVELSASTDAGTARQDERVLNAMQF
jgi:hypothetical protein